MGGMGFWLDIVDLFALFLSFIDVYYLVSKLA